MPTPRRLLHLLAVLAAAALGAAAPALAQPDPHEGFGYNVQSLARAVSAPNAFFPVADWPTYLGPMAADGLRLARTDATWWAVEPDAPSGGRHTYDWSATDQIADGLAAEGLRWDVVLAGAPSWAAIDPANRWSAPTSAHAADFAAFAAAFAARYGRGGAFWAEHPELPAMPVARYEVWNEPNTPDHWGGPPDPGACAALFAQAEAAITAVQPDADVLVGGLVWNDDVAYLSAFLAALPAGTPVDGLAVHPYAPTVYALETNLVRVRAALDALGHPSVPLEVNELGWPAAYDRAPAPRASEGPVSDLSRSATMSLAIDALADSTCEVGSLAVFDLVEPEDDPGHVESLMGLLRPGGAPTLTSEAFAGAVARYRATAAQALAPVPVCGARGAAVTRLLPLGLSGERERSGCVDATVTYRGAPLEEARVVALGEDGVVAPTDAAGHATVCPRSAAGRRGLHVSADVLGAAGSGTLDCAGARCRLVGPTAVCALQNAHVAARVRVTTLLRAGLQVRTHACRPELGGPAQLRAVLELGRHPWGGGSAAVALDGTATLRARLTRAARRALRGRHRRALTLVLRASEPAGSAQVMRRRVALVA